jgi:hypothetical protein
LRIEGGSKGGAPRSPSWGRKVPNHLNSILCEWKHNTALNRNRSQQLKLVWLIGSGAHGWSIRASWDACKELRWAELCKPPLPPCIEIYASLLTLQQTAVGTHSLC